MEQTIQPDYYPLLDHPLPPNIRNLQRTIEAAWKDGYDAEGAKDLQSKLTGTNKWIGTAELYTAFSYRGIPVELVDFDLKHQDNGVKAVTDWVVRYFSPSSLSGKVKTSIDDALRGASPIISTNQMPIILQHAGHSRTIIGFEVTKKGIVNLLTFDPSK